MEKLEQIKKEVIEEMSLKIQDLSPKANDRVSEVGIKQGIINISAEICCKIIEKYLQDKQK